MPKTRSQSAAEGGGSDHQVIDPPTNITMIDIVKRVVRWARALHFVAATVEDTDSTKTGFIDKLQQAGSRAVVVARKMRNFHEERWREGRVAGPGDPQKLPYGGEDDDDEDDDEEEVEAEVEAAFDQDFSLERAVAIAIDFEARIVALIDERREAMLALRDPEGADFLAKFVEQYNDSIGKWDRIGQALNVSADEGGDAAIDMIVRRNWLR